MKHHLLIGVLTILGLRVLGVAAPVLFFNQLTTDPIPPKEKGPYARIAVLRPHENDTVDFEAGYARHLAWHKQAGDKWSWYGWTISIGEQQRWFVYATFGHSAASLDAPVNPLEDERDSISNVNPHAEFAGGGLYEFLPELSHEANDFGEPRAAARMELTTVELKPGTSKAFEAAIRGGESEGQGEALWFRMVAGGSEPRYVRLRPRANLQAILEGKGRGLPEEANSSIAKMAVEILNLRPTMCYGLENASPGTKAGNTGEKYTLERRGK